MLPWQPARPEDDATKGKPGQGRAGAVPAKDADAIHWGGGGAGIAGVVRSCRRLGHPTAWGAKLACSLGLVRSPRLPLQPSLTEVHRLSCSVACGISAPQAGIEPASPALGGKFLTAGPPGKSLQIVLDRDPAWTW